MHLEESNHKSSKDQIPIVVLSLASLQPSFIGFCVALMKIQQLPFDCLQKVQTAQLILFVAVFLSFNMTVFNIAVFLITYTFMTTNILHRVKHSPFSKQAALKDS